MSNTDVLFDGWELSFAPLSPPALHLLDLLAHLPTELTAEVALPAAPPHWLPATIQVQVHETPASPRGRHQWEQRTLPQLARKRQAILHAPTPSVALASRQTIFVSPSAESGPTDNSFRSRLRRAVGRGGMAGARILWPEDVPVPIEHTEPDRLSPAVHPAFTPKETFLPPSIDEYPEIPASFFLVHVPPDLTYVRTALDAWTWAAGPIGDVYPLVFLGLPDELKKEADVLSRQLHLADTVLFFPELPPTRLHLLYQASSAIFHPAPVGPWNSPLRFGIACAKPVVGIETAISGAIAGPAAYFAQENDPRGLGAALISVVVRDDIRKQLIDNTRHRTASWSHERLITQLAKIYQR